MRIVTWNCRVGGFRYKSAPVAALRPDVLVVQECEPLDGVLLFAGGDQPTWHHRLADPAYPRRAIGVFSYSGTEITPVDLDAPQYGFRRLTARLGDTEFNIAAIWTADTDDRAAAYRQAVDGLRMHADWFRQRPTVMLGDFNDNAAWPRGFWPQILDLTAPLGLVSAYHTFFDEPFGAETRPTYFHHGKQSHAFHLDYCFVPAEWVPQVSKVEVGGYQEWQTVSDHRPVIVDVDLPQRS